MKEKEEQSKRQTEGYNLESEKGIADKSSCFHYKMSEL